MTTSDLSSMQFVESAAITLADLDGVTSLAHATLGSVRSFVVDGNASLVDLQFPLLSATDRVRLTKNGALSQADAEAFASATGAPFQKVAGNVGDTVPRESCPWQEDGECNEELGLCVSDPLDCEPPAGQ